MVDLPEWASGALQRSWPLLSDEEREAIIADREASLLRTAAQQLRATDLDRTAGGDFTLDGLSDRQWHAVAFGDPWNGWATPIVTVQTLQNMLDDFVADGSTPAGEIAPDGAFRVYREEPESDFTIWPNANGEYALWELSWTFRRLP